MCKRSLLIAALLLLWGGLAEAQVPPSRILCTGTNCTPIVASSTHPFLSTAAVYTAQIKGSAGIVWAVDCWNNGTDTAWVRLYNQTGAPATTDGANISWRFPVPPASSGVASGFLKLTGNGMNFGTGIGIRVTEAVADNDATALNANEVGCTVEYQ